MAYSVIYASGDGVTKTFPISYPLGFISRSDITCRVGTEVDGTGNPVFRTLTWISDGLVTVSGTAPPVGVDNVKFYRTVSKTTLIHDYANGVAIEEANLDESNKQLLMALQEFLDGRFTEGDTIFELAERAEAAAEAAEASAFSISLPIPIASGGTGSTTPELARAALGSEAAGVCVPLAGGTMTGTLTLSETPANGDISKTAASTAFVNAHNGASMVLLASATASGSSSIDFTSIPGGYDEYLLTTEALTPATDISTLNLRMSTDNGANWLASNYRYAQFGVNSGGISEVRHDDAATAIPVSYMPISNDPNTGGIGAKVSLPKMSGSSCNKFAYLTAVVADAGNSKRSSVSFGGASYFGSLSAVNALRLFFSSGNIASGKASLYGIRSA